MKTRKWPTILLGLVITIASIFFTAYLKNQRRDRNQNLIAEVFYREKEVKWVKNSFYGLIFETPNEGLNPKEEITNLDFPDAKASKLNYLETGDFLCYVFYADLSTNQYDFVKGMDGALSNLVKEIDGEDLQYEFSYGDSWLPYALAEGQFKINSEEIIFNAFLSFNPSKRKGNNLRGLVLIGNKSDQNQDVISRSIASIDLDTLKRENSLFKWLTENAGKVQKNYDPSDSILTPDQLASSKRLSLRLERYRQKINGKEALGGEKGYNPGTSETKELEPEGAGEYYNQGNAKSKLQDYRGAIDDFTKSIEIDPSSDAYNNRGIAKAKLGDHKGAINDFTIAISLDPSDPSGYTNRGGSRGAVEDFKEALVDFTKAIEIDPNNGAGFFGSGICKLKLGQKNNGCSDLIKAERLGHPGANEAKLKYCK